MSRWDRRVEEIEEEADRTLRNAGVSSPPVSVRSVAEDLGITVRSSEFGEGVSGLLTLEKGTPTIGYEKSHPNVRQRFTIAHETGHYVLHKDKSTLFIDKKYSNVFYRDDRSSDAEYTRELEANALAAALLMPTDMLREEIVKRDFDLTEEDSLSSLARAFDVSRQAMAYRLANSGIFSGAPDHLDT
jgi:Zn-dependent peptidase ImmA (M78 family)